MAQQLSNIEVILLYIVNAKPSYAYDINKVIDYRNIRMWVRVGVASIYQVLRRLEEKKMLYSQVEKEGKMPDRKRYYITKFGKKALTEASRRLLANMDYFYMDLNIGLESSDILTPREIAISLISRLDKVKTNIRRMKEINMCENKSLFKKRALIKNLIFMREAEEAFLEEVLKDMSIGT